MSRFLWGHMGHAIREENMMLYGTVVGISPLLGGYHNHVEH